MKDSNRRVYQTKDVVEYHQDADELKVPEQLVLDEFRDRLAKMRFLDVGIGGGRTTHHFASAVKEYVGIDYSEEMINACRQRFKNHPGSMTFRVVDARDMQAFNDGEFDFILFSHNGIDYITHEDRLCVLKNIRRVCRAGGYFCFSSHNLNADLRDHYRFRLYPSWRVTYKKFKWSLMYFLRNRGRYSWDGQPYALVRDDMLFFRLQTYYIRPQAQIEQLTQTGFTNIRLFSRKGEIDLQQRSLNDLREIWIYYLCNKSLA